MSIWAICDNSEYQTQMIGDYCILSFFKHILIVYNRPNYEISLIMFLSEPVKTMFSLCYRLELRGKQCFGVKQAVFSSLPISLVVIGCYIALLTIHF